MGTMRTKKLWAHLCLYDRKYSELHDWVVSQTTTITEEAVREKCGEEDSTEPRGVWQCDDLDWTLYYLDVGSLVQ